MSFDVDFDDKELGDLSAFDVGSPKIKSNNILNEFSDLGDDWGDEVEFKKGGFTTLKDVPLDYCEDSISKVLKEKEGNYDELRKAVLLEGFKKGEEKYRELVWSVLLKREPLKSDEYTKYFGKSVLNEQILIDTKNEKVQWIANAVVNWFDRHNYDIHILKGVGKLTEIFYVTMNELNTFYCCIAFLLKISKEFYDKKAWKAALAGILSIVDMELCSNCISIIDIAEVWLNNFCLSLYNQGDCLKLMDYLIASRPSYCLYLISALLVSQHKELLSSLDIKLCLNSLRPIPINRLITLANMLYTQSYVPLRNYIDLL